MIRSERQLPEMYLQSRIPISQDTLDDDALFPKPERSEDGESKMTSACEMGFDGPFK